MTEAALLLTLVEAEHAAVYGYGVLGARLDLAARRAAITAYDAHRARRDGVVAALTARQIVLPTPPAAYEVSARGRGEALALAIRLEEGLALRWRDLVGGTDAPELRRLGVSALQECAVRAAQWRRLAGIIPVSVPLPGA